MPRQTNDLLKAIEQEVDRHIKAGEQQAEKMETLLRHAKKVVAGDRDPVAKHLEKRLQEENALEAWKRKQGASVPLFDIFGGQEERHQLQRKAMTTGTNFEGRVADELRLGAFRPRRRLQHIRPLMASDETTESSVSYVQETGFTEQAAVTQEGNLKPESELSFTEKRAYAEVIADTARVTSQMLDDASFLAAYLSSRMREGLRKAEDQSILYGQGAPDDLEGITTHPASAFDATRFTELVDAGEILHPQRIDVLRFAILQARKANHQVDTILLNPEDMAVIDSLKDEDGRYLDALKRLGVTAYESNAVQEGGFITGSLGDAGTALLLERQPPTLNFYAQDRDNVPKNVVTIRVEERLTVPVFRPEGVVIGTFDEALNPQAT